MQIITQIAEMQAAAERLRTQGERIGVVPTMGYLHEGHLSLVRIARSQSDIVIVTVFVNPRQFGPNEDYERYPRNLEQDQQLVAQAGADVFFAPEAGAMYGEGYATVVEVEGISSMLEGAFRPTHFRGVTTVVAKLFHITKPHLAVFGQKDAQQAFLIRRMARDLNFDLQVVVAPTVREADGLAMSSRNVYLSADERSRATSLYRALHHAETRIAHGERSLNTLNAEMAGILSQANPTTIDYIAFVDPDTFKTVELLRPPSVLVLLAVRFGSTRLIDNVIVPIS